MSALLKIEAYEAVTAAAVAKTAAWTPELIVTAHLPRVEERPMSFPKRVALFLASPVVGLAYIAAMPVVAAALLAWLGAKALAARTPASVKKAGLILASPLLGLGFIVALPLAGVTALGYYAFKAGEKA